MQFYQKIRDGLLAFGALVLLSVGPGVSSNATKTMILPIYFAQLDGAGFELEVNSKFVFEKDFVEPYDPAWADEVTTHIEIPVNIGKNTYALRYLGNDFEGTFVVDQATDQLLVVPGFTLKEYSAMVIVLEETTEAE